MSIFEQAFLRSIQCKQDCIREGFATLEKMGQVISDSLRGGGKLMLCGNGGSAADAQHLAAELLIRLRPSVNRCPLPALTLALDTSTITACANDYSFEELYSRNVEALANEGDCLIGISTSGNSENILRALIAARRKNVHALAFLGNGGGKCLDACDLAYVVPSGNTASIQEAHIVAGHALMELIEVNICEL